MISSQKMICLAVELNAFRSSKADNTLNQPFLHSDNAGRSEMLPQPLKAVNISDAPAAPFRCLNSNPHDTQPLTFGFRSFDDAARAIMQHPILPENPGTARQFNKATTFPAEQ